MTGKKLGAIKKKWPLIMLSMLVNTQHILLFFIYIKHKGLLV